MSANMNGYIYQQFYYATPEGGSSSDATRTRDYMAFLYQADQLGNRDNSASRPELDNLINRYSGQREYLGYFSPLYKDVFPNAQGAARVLDNYKGFLNNQIQVGQNLYDNFNTFARSIRLFPGQVRPDPDSPIPGGLLIGDNRLITFSDIYRVARSDGNAATLTQNDLDNPRPYVGVVADLFTELGRSVRNGTF